MKSKNSRIAIINPNLKIMLLSETVKGNSCHCKFNLCSDYLAEKDQNAGFRETKKIKAKTRPLLVPMCFQGVPLSSLS